ncbi:SAM-dependent DNA methyltransferase [Mucilaginibacter sp. ZT4R22]|uniref:site-specific DNA-methyltransferase (adenine-specific) n=1 Tax=Mucilaginibacter pankratovii TaxID=2772110 RepID=A0ABR7WQ27_9SPHI|nr:N-6 DNA methylase [Mucilaginibacter pankratovii]MBD1364433.1 SAM-dependent DNA methyltransferase [Mucilaginibacter pankratovii]
MLQSKQLLTSFERFAYGQSLHTAFVELLDWTLLPFKKWDKAELQSKALETYQSHPKVNQLVTLINIIGNLSEDFNDPLGELYMQAISNGHNGQYFTPTPICDMLAAFNIDSNSKPAQSVCDPACGSGRMLLAAAKLNRHMHFYGADLDSTCCKMALVNMMLNSLTGEIAHMNTLSNDFYTGYRTATTIINGYNMPFYTEFTDPDLSYICLHDLKGNKAKSTFNTPFAPVRALQPINGVQGSLF